MRRERQQNFRQLFEFKGPVNYTETVYLAYERDQSRKPYLIKRTPIVANVVPIIQNVIKALYGNNQTTILKPEYYSFQDGCLYQAQNILPLSLETILRLHRSDKVPFSRQIMWTFTCKIYETLNKLAQGSNLFHKNLKPSNIFYQSTPSQTVWKVGEACLPSGASSLSAYSKPSDIVFSKSTMYNQAVDPRESDFYSLGLIVIEMMTLQDLETIKAHLESKANLESLSGFKEAKSNYGEELALFVRGLLNTKDNLKQLYHDLHKNQPEAELSSLSSKLNYDKFELTDKILDKFIESGLILETLTSLKKMVVDNSLEAQDVLQRIVKRYDADYNFAFEQTSELEGFLNDFGMKMTTSQNLFLISFYYSRDSRLRYTPILLEIMKPSDIVRAVMARCLTQYSSLKEFFEIVSDGRDYWKKEAICAFINKIGFEINEKKVQQILFIWTKDNKKGSLKYQEFVEIFRDINPSHLSNKSILQGQNACSEEQLSQLLSQLSAAIKDGNLVSFFRLSDYKGKWVVFPSIEKQIKKFVKASDSSLKAAINRMVETGGIPGDQQRQIRYVFLLKTLKFHKLTELFRLVITERINETSRQAFYQKYKKIERGWSIESIIDFNHDEGLDFDERELREIFRSLDADSSQFIDEKQLFHRLYGVIEFDQKLIVDQIQQFRSSSKLKLFKHFLEHDSNRDLLFDSAKELRRCLEELQVNLPNEHCSTLFEKYSNPRIMKFEYIVFLRHFYTCFELFLESTKCMIEDYCGGDFDKFFALGLKGRGQVKSSKWNLASLRCVNSEYVLGFTDNELGEVWKEMDKNEDGSLSRQELAEVYKFSVQKYEAFQPKAVDYVNKPSKGGSKAQLESPAKNDRGSERERISTGKKNPNNNIIDELCQVDLQSFTKNLFLEGQGVGWAEIPLALLALVNQKVKVQKSVLAEFVEEHFMVEGSTKKLNIFKLCFFIADHMDGINRDKQRELKASVTQTFLKYACKAKNLSSAHLMKKCRREGRMRSADFQRIINELAEVDIFSSDLEDVWMAWGDPEDLSLADLQEKIEMSRTKVKKSFSFGKEPEQETKLRRKYPQDQDDKDPKFSKGKNQKQKQRTRNRIQDEERKQEIQKESKYTNQREKGFKRNEPFEEQPMDRKSQKFNQEGFNNQRDSKQPEYEIKVSKIVQRRESREGPLGYKDQRQDNQKYLRTEKEPKYRQQQESEEEKNQTRDNRGVKHNRIQSKEKEDSDDENWRKKNNNKRDNDDDSRYPARESSYGKKERDRNDFDKSERMPPDDKRSLNTRFERFNDVEQSESHYYPGKKSQKDIEMIGTKGQRDEQTIKPLLTKLRSGVSKYGPSSIQRLVSQPQNQIQPNSLIRALERYYGFEAKQANKLTFWLQNGSKTISADRIFEEAGIQTENNKGIKKRDQVHERSNQESARRTQPRKTRLDIPLIKDTIKLLIQSFTSRFEKSQLRSYFFQGNASYLTRDRFIRLASKINNSIPSDLYERIFDFMRPSVAEDTIGHTQFKLGFEIDTDALENVETYLPKELERQLREVFEKADTDRSGSIETSQIQGLIRSLGLEESQKDLIAYFQKIDSNFDGKISFKQFIFFFEDILLPQVSNFDEDKDLLYSFLRMNDLSNNGILGSSYLWGAIQRFGVSLTDSELLSIVRHLGHPNNGVAIFDLLEALEYPSHPSYPPALKTALYKIRLHRKVTLKDCQKVFRNISSTFQLAYTAQICRKGLLLPSTCHTPVLHKSKLFYEDIFYKDIRKVERNCPETLLVSELSKDDLLVEVRLEGATGIPSPQNQAFMKAILKRYVNVSFFDTSSESVRLALCCLDVQWDPDTADEWQFSKNSKQLFVKIAKYEARKWQKILLLFEFVISLVESERVYQVSCGSASLSIKELLANDKTTKKLKVSAGLPNKSRQIDQESVAKKKGWRGLLGSSQSENELNITILQPQSFKTNWPQLAAMPAVCIVNRKLLHFCCTFREFMAENSVDSGRVRTNFAQNPRVKTYTLCWDVPEVASLLPDFWQKAKEKITNILQAKQVFTVTMDGLRNVILAKQFELTPSIPQLSRLIKGSLHKGRLKMIEECLNSILDWIRDQGVKKPYTRRVVANYTFNPTWIDPIPEYMRIERLVKATANRVPPVK